MRITMVLIGLATAFLIACGGGDDDDDNGSTGASNTGATTEATASTGGTTGSTGAGTTGSTGSTGSSDEELNIEEDCPALQNLVGDFDFENALGSTGSDPFAGLDADFFQDAADRAPNEIKDDMNVLADAFGEFFGALEELEVDFSDPASLVNLTAEEQQRLLEISESFDSDEVNEALDNVGAYLEEECG